MASTKTLNRWAIALAVVLVGLVAALSVATPTPLLREMTRSNVTFPVHGDVLYLDDGNSHTYTIPSSTTFVLLSPVDMTANTSATAWCRQDAAGALPTDDVTDGSASVPITGPSVWRISGVTTIRCIRTGSNVIAVYIAPYQDAVY